MVQELYIPENEDTINGDWLQQALAAGGYSDVPAITGVSFEEIGVGVGMVGRLLRCHVAYQSEADFAPLTIVIKLPSADDNTRRTAHQLQLYQREFDFYRTLATSVPIRTPALLYGDFDALTHDFVLLLEDMGHMDTVDQVGGATEDRAMVAIRAAAQMHARYWDRIDQPPVSTVHSPPGPERHAMVQAVYQASLPRVFHLFEDQFTVPMRQLAESYGSHLVDTAVAIAAEPQTLIHGDFRLDNMFFGTADDAGVVLVDWQLSTVGSGLYDVAYFLSSCVSTQVRREIESAAIESYHHIIDSQTGGNFTHEQCWQSYRQNVLTCFRVPVIAGAQLDLNSDRGRRLADTILQRTLAAMDDLEVNEFLPPR